MRGVSESTRKWRVPDGANMILTKVLRKGLLGQPLTYDFNTGYMIGDAMIGVTSNPVRSFPFVMISCDKVKGDCIADNITQSRYY